MELPLIQHTTLREKMMDDDYDPYDDDPETSTGAEKRKRDKGYELVKAALESHLVEYASRRHTQKRNVEQLTKMIEEYASTFVLLGYNYDGEPVTIVSANTQQQSDSLSTLIQKFIVKSSPSDPTMF